MKDLCDGISDEDHFIKFLNLLMQDMTGMSCWLAIFQLGNSLRKGKEVC